MGLPRASFWGGKNVLIRGLHSTVKGSRSNR